MIRGEGRVNWNSEQKEWTRIPVSYDTLGDSTGAQSRSVSVQTCFCTKINLNKSVFCRSEQIVTFKMFLFLRVFCQFQEFVKSFVFLSSVRSNLCPCFVVLYHYRRDTTHNSVSVFLKELTVQFYQFDSVSIQVLLCKFFIKTSSFH